MQIENTGERILPEKETPLFIARHFCAYKFAGGYCAGKKVLDIGTGEGYGAHYLSKISREVIGLDYDAQAVSFAKEKYKAENLQFCQLNIKNLKSIGKLFEVVCCFQVIEHIEDADNFLEQIREILTDSGVFICSTPNKLDASPNSDTPLNKFHVLEYEPEEFTGLLGKYFGKVDIYGLKRGKRLIFYRRLKKIGVFNFLPINFDPVKRYYNRINCDEFAITKKDLSSSLDFIAVCRK